GEQVRIQRRQKSGRSRRDHIGRREPSSEGNRLRDAADFPPEWTMGPFRAAARDVGMGQQILFGFHQFPERERNDEKSNEERPENDQRQTAARLVVPKLHVEQFTSLGRASVV